MIQSASNGSDFASPSLVLGQRQRAYELKFVLDDNRTAMVQQWADIRLAPDPHGDPALHGAYRTTTLYCDTPELDVFHRADSYRRRKFRVRRYGLMSGVYLERKTKAGDRVQKRRSLVASHELELLAQPMSLETWPGHWFHQQLHLQRLRPSCLITYLRTACVGSCPEGPLRLTLDRDLRGLLCDQWSLTPFHGGLPFLAGQVILELKFRGALPMPFKELLSILRLNPLMVSKYRLCREVWGAEHSKAEAARA